MGSPCEPLCLVNIIDIWRQKYIKKKSLTSKTATVRLLSLFEVVYSVRGPWEESWFPYIISSQILAQRIQKLNHWGYQGFILSQSPNIIAGWEISWNLQNQADSFRFDAPSTKSKSTTPNKSQFWFCYASVSLTYKDSITCSIAWRPPQLIIIGLGQWHSLRSVL